MLSRFRLDAPQFYKAIVFYYLIDEENFPGGIETNTLQTCIQPTFLKGLSVCVIVIVEVNTDFKKLEKTVLDPPHCMVYFLGAKLVRAEIAFQWTNFLRHNSSAQKCPQAYVAQVSVKICTSYKSNVVAVFDGGVF